MGEGGLSMKSLLLILFAIAPVLSAQEWGDFNAPMPKGYSAAADNTRVNVQVVKTPRAAGDTERLYKMYGNDYSKHVPWHIKTVSLYVRPAGGSELTKADAESSIRALTMLAAGSSPLIGADQAYWAIKTLIDAFKYAPDTEIKALAGLSLAVASAGKPHETSFMAADALASAVLHEREDFSIRRIAVSALSAINSVYSTGKLGDCARALARTHDIIGRQKFRAMDEDEDVWSLEAALVMELAGKLGVPALADRARGWLEYFAALDYACGGQYSTLKTPNTDGIDATLMINSRLALGEKLLLQTNGDNPETGTAGCLLPIANAGSTCGMRKKASGQFRRIHGAVYSQSGSRTEGEYDCTELITQKAMAKFAFMYVSGYFSIEAFAVKGVIRLSSKGIAALGGMNNARKAVAYRQIVTKLYDAKSDIDDVKEYLKAAEEVTR